MIILTALGWLKTARNVLVGVITRYPMQCALAALLLACAWLWNGKVNAIAQRNQARAEIAAIRADAIERAKRVEQSAQKLGASIAAIKRENEHEIKVISARRDALLVQLRTRPPRAVSTAAQTARDAVGCTGAGLSASDAEFLARYAADAAETAVTLNACTAAYDAARDMMEGLQ